MTVPVKYVLQLCIEVPVVQLAEGMQLSGSEQDMTIPVFAFHCSRSGHSESDTRHAMQMIQVKSFNARDPDSIRHLIHRSNLVVNLIGIQKETMNWSFQETHVDVAARIAEAVKENELVERFWHVGCLGANENSTSRRLQSKVLLELMHMVVTSAVRVCIWQTFKLSACFETAKITGCRTWHSPTTKST